MPTTFPCSTTNSAPMFLSAIRLAASNAEAVGSIVYTAWSGLDRRICAAVFMNRLSNDCWHTKVGGSAPRKAPARIHAVGPHQANNPPKACTFGAGCWSYDGSVG